MKGSRAAAASRLRVGAHVHALATVLWYGWQETSRELSMTPERPTVVITNWVQEAVLRLLAPHFEIVANPDREPWPESVLSRHLARADALIAFMPDLIDARALDQAPNLKMLSCCLKGFDNFDIDACTRRGVLVTILPDLLTEPGAELAIGMMIAAGRHVLAADRHVRQGAFKGWRPRFYGTGLAGSTIGIVGFGAVGRAFAERLKPFRADVAYWDRRRLDAAAEHELGVRHADLPDLIATSDFLVIALSLSSETRHFIDAERLARMKAGAILVNFARGSLVNEAAVARALEDGHLGFYAADAFAFEDWAIPDRPREIHPRLLALTDRTLFTPHLGSAVTRVREEMALQAAQNVIDFFRGTVPRGAVNGDIVVAR